MHSSLYFLLYLHLELNGSSYKIVSVIDPSIEYFSRDHAPFAVFAIFILIALVLLPSLLLAFYPVRAFRLLLQKCKLSGHCRAGLNQFVEKFYSCYRDVMRGFLLLPFFLRFTSFLGIILQDQILFWFFQLSSFLGS